MKRVLVTGATSGIGRSTVLHLARAGHHVIAAGRRKALLDALVVEANEAGKVEALALDVTADLDAPLAELDRLTDGYGVDVLVNNAGFGVAAATAEIGLDDVRAQFDTNVFGALALAQRLWPRMAARGRGTIVNVSSLGGRLVLPMYGAYNASKFAIEALSDALRLELAPLGVDVVVIEPSVVRTSFIERSLVELDRYGSSRFAHALRSLAEQRPMLEARAIDASEVAEAIAKVVAARRPAPRIAVPRSHGWAISVAKMLPTRVRDAVLRRAGGMQPRALTASS